MLRVALVLSLFAFAAVALSGCPNGCLDGDDCSAGLGTSPDMARPDLAPRDCPSTCAAGCAAGEQCITPFPTGADSRAFCARTCGNDGDCAGGERCLVFFAAMQPSVCVPDSLQISCDASSSGGICDTPPTCDGDVANLHYADGPRGFCGWERKLCPNGCSNGACNP